MLSLVENSSAAFLLRSNNYFWFLDGRSIKVLDTKVEYRKGSVRHPLTVLNQLIEQGDEITVNEYFDVINNRNIFPIPLMPGISIVGMGTDYKRLKKNETGIVNLHYDNQFKNISIVPSSLAKKN
jgi:hypothetical protein